MHSPHFSDIENYSQDNFEVEKRDVLNDDTRGQRKRRIIIIAVLAAIIVAIILAITLPLAITPQRPHASDVKSNEKVKAASQTRLISAEEQRGSNPPDYSHDVSPYSKLTKLKVLDPADDSRVFVMGDIHGCLEEMNALLDTIQFDQNRDVIILSGDLVARGSDSLGVIRRAREIGAYCVRGNHDDKVVRFKSYMLEHGSLGDSDEVMPEGSVGDPLKFRNKHAAIAKELSDEDYEYLMGCPLILDIPSLNSRVVHGGLDPSIQDILDNDPWSVMNMRDLDINHKPSKKKLNKKNSHIDHWTTRYNALNTSDTTIYYGHDASRGVVIREKTVGVDSGCIYGRQLSVIEMRTKGLSQVNCDNRERKAQAIKAK